MPEYGQFCPVAKASDIIGERWTVLILRELLLGTTRYNDFQRGLSRISPTLLSKRLKMLEDKGWAFTLSNPFEIMGENQESLTALICDQSACR